MVLDQSVEKVQVHLFDTVIADAFNIPAPSELAMRVRAAQDDVKNIPALFEALMPALKAIAIRIAPQCVDDAIQAAQIKIWRNVDRVDLSRHNTIRALLCRMAHNAMRDEIRKWLRQHPKGVEAWGPDDLGEIVDRRTELRMDQKEYLDRVLETYALVLQDPHNEGKSFETIHDQVSWQLKVPPTIMAKVYNMAVLRLVESMREEGIDVDVAGS